MKSTLQTVLSMLVCLFFVHSLSAKDINIEEWQGSSRASGKLPLMFINTENGDSVLDKETKIPAGLWIEIPENCPEKDFALGSKDAPISLEIKGRGNSTWKMPKKPYKLKFTKKTAILGMPKHKHFALQACYGNAIDWGAAVGGMELGRLTGMPWCSRVEPVELILNGTYEGLYFVFESIKIDENRVDIYEQPEENTDPATIPYGWLVELDNYEDEFQIKVPENPNTGSIMRVTHKSPELLSDQQRDWLINDFTEMCKVIYADSATAERWVDYIEPLSLARYYIVREVMTDPDGFNGSTYLNKDNDGDTRWHFGPMWDCSVSPHNVDPYWTMDNLPSWSTWQLIPGIKTTANFEKALLQVWSDFYPEQFNTITDYLHDLNERVLEADIITWERWGEPYEKPYKGLVDYVLRLLTRKAAFMDDYYQSLISAGVEDVVSDAELVAERYYTLEGIELAQPLTNGLYIKSSVYSDGTVKTSKVLAR